VNDMCERLNLNFQHHMLFIAATLTSLHWHQWSIITLDR